MHPHRKDWKDAMGFFDEMDEFAELPLAEPDPENKFEVDKNVNVETIDDYLGIPGVTYLDMRMIDDTAKWCDVGGDAKLSFMVKGFKIVPWPLIGTLDKLPVGGAYTEKSLFTITWNEESEFEVLDVKPNYEESMMILEDLFPRDQPILFMCGGGGYSQMARKFLLFMGWDIDLLYNTGGGWKYAGPNRIDLIEEVDDDVFKYYLWRADHVMLNFDQLTPIG